MSFTPSGAPISRGELAKRSGCHLETVRYYEKIGLLPPPARTQGGHRLYQIDDQRRLRFILRGRELGFSIEELRSLLSLVDSESYTCGEVYDLTVGHLKSVRQKIADLKRLERMLTKISKDCSGGSVPECQLDDDLWSDKSALG